jgi:hypothetical protein
LIETNNIKKNLFKKDCENIFINLKEIINI